MEVRVPYSLVPITSPLSPQVYNLFKRAFVTLGTRIMTSSHPHSYTNVSQRSINVLEGGEPRP